MPNQRSIQIRAGVENDASALAAFAARTFEETFGADNRPDDLRAHLSHAFGIARQTQELLNPRMISLLAHEEAALVAFAQVHRSTDRTTPILCRSPCAWERGCATTHGRGP
jgi:hypothetical protein